MGIMCFARKLMKFLFFWRIRIMKTKTWLCLLAVCGAGLFCGCEVLEEAIHESYASEDPTSDDFEPRFVVGAFEIVRYPRALTLEKEITAVDGQSMWINANPLFSSRRIRSARAVPRPGNPDVCDLEFRIDRMGKTQWQMLSDGHRGEALALMVDSRHVGNFVPESTGYGNAEWVRVRVGMDPYTARGVAKFAKKNYAHFNPDASDWFSNL